MAAVPRFQRRAGGRHNRSRAEPQQRADSQDQRRILNEGYSIFYSTLDGLSKFDLVFLVKSETKPVNEVTTAVTEYADTLKATLERVANDYPAVDIELDPLPVMEQRTRGGMTKDRILSFAPVVGLTGESFDRRMLQALEGTLNNLRFMAKALADEEPEPSLKQIATTAHTRLEQLYQRVLNMLDEKYFINTGEQKVAMAMMPRFPFDSLAIVASLGPPCGKGPAWAHTSLPRAVVMGGGTICRVVSSGRRTIGVWIVGNPDDRARSTHAHAPSKKHSVRATRTAALLQLRPLRASTWSAQRSASAAILRRMRRLDCRCHDFRC